MAVTPLITRDQADTYNDASTAWLALTNDEKDAHIYTATVYMQTMWTCTDVEWDDLTTLDDDLLRACAYYADADRQGYLYPTAEIIEGHRALTRKTQKLGSMEKTLEWSDTAGLRTARPLSPIDSIMYVYCVRTGGGSGVVTRV